MRPTYMERQVLLKQFNMFKTHLEQAQACYSEFEKKVNEILANEQEGRAKDTSTAPVEVQEVVSTDEMQPWLLATEMVDYIHDVVKVEEKLSKNGMTFSSDAEEDSRKFMRSFFLTNGSLIRSVVKQPEFEIEDHYVKSSTVVSLGKSAYKLTVVGGRYVHNTDLAKELIAEGFFSNALNANESEVENIGNMKYYVQDVADGALAYAHKYSMNIFDDIRIKLFDDKHALEDFINAECLMCFDDTNKHKAESLFGNFQRENIKLVELTSDNDLLFVGDTGNMIAVKVTQIS